MLSQSKGFVEKYFPGEYELTDTPMFGYEIHIGKRSMGWKPLFQEHKNAYDSVEELVEFIIKHSVVLYDEYGTILTEKELKENLIDWGEKQTKQYYKFVPKGFSDKSFGWKEYLQLVNKNDEYDIVSPFDHKEYQELMKSVEPFDIKFSNDKNGYNFTDREFS
jgi:hypothetical protein